MPQLDLLEPAAPATSYSLEGYSTADQEICAPGPLLGVGIGIGIGVGKTIEAVILTSFSRFQMWFFARFLS